MSESNNNKPVFKSKYGLVEASVWENEAEKGKFYSITTNRSYKTDKDEWANTNSMRVNDIHSLILALEDCYKFTKTKKEE